MKRLVVVLVLVVISMLTSCNVCLAQLNGIIKAEKTITTAVDTTAITGKDFVAVELQIFKDTKDDTLQFRTNNEATWGSIYDSTRIHFGKVYAKQLFLKAKSGSGIKVRVFAN